MTRDDAIQTFGLTRYFGSRAVVRDLDFSVPRGSIVGLLGLNGAGKSTTIRMLLGFLAPTRGRSLVLGQDSMRLTPADRVRMGHTVEGHFLYSWMRVEQCESFGRSTIPSWNRETFFSTVDRFRIAPRQRVAWLSRGQRAGVSIASMLATDPELLVLDDPALGLDPVSRRALNETLIDFCASGTRTVLLSSHLLDDIERVADRIAIMIDGRLWVDAPIDRFRERVSSWQIESELDSDTSARIPRLIQARRCANRTIISVVDADAETQQTLVSLGEPVTLDPDIAFEDAVLAYLSRQRSDSTYLRRKGLAT